MKFTDHVAGTLSEIDRRVVEAVPPGGNWRDLPIDFPSKRVDQIRKGAASGGGSRSTYYGRLRWERPAYTINTYLTRPGNGCFIHPEQPRLITVREAARLQSFPDHIRFRGTMRSRCRQVGNAVPPLLAKAIGSVLPRGRVVDLFAGAGGFGLGLEMAGHDVVLSSDLDRSCLATLDSYASGEVLRADMTDPDDFEAILDRASSLAPDLDLLVGGPPCQGFSTAGPCRIDDPRNRLVLAFLDFIRVVQPQRLLMENVVALRWRGGVFLNEFEESLREMGYNVETRVLHAEAYGVPQLRRRLVVQGSLSGEPIWPAPDFEILDPAFRNDQPGSDGPQPARSVFEAIGDLPGDEAADLDALLEYRSPPQSEFQVEMRCKNTPKPLASSA